MSAEHGPLAARVAGVIPGVALCAAIAVAAFAVATVEARLVGRGLIGPVFWALLIGMALRAFRDPAPVFGPGMTFSARPLLEIAIVLFGAGVNPVLLGAITPALAVQTVLLVLGCVTASYLLARMMGLTGRLSALIACGNSICGNSAIAAARPIVGATPTEVSTAIAFTALPGLALALSLPLLSQQLALTPTQHGLLAGLTVYAIPQVLAAAEPFGDTAVQVALLVKLMRIATLGPMLVWVGWLSTARTGGRVRLAGLLPWYVLGFAVVACLSLSGLVAAPLLAAANHAALILTVIAMAALGLATDTRALFCRGGRIAAATLVSLAILIGLSLMVTLRA